MSLSYLAAARTTTRIAEQLRNGTLTLDDEGRHLARLPPPLPFPHARPLTVMMSLEAAMYYSQRSQPDGTMLKGLLDDETKLTRALQATDEELVADPNLRTLRSFAKASAAFGEIKPRKRPGLDNFLARLAPEVELVVFTDQPMYIAEHMLERMDQVRRGVSDAA
jgi:hypothetical protein